MAYYAITHARIDDATGRATHVRYALINPQTNSWGSPFADVDIDQIIMLLMSDDHVYALHTIEGLGPLGPKVGVVVGENGYEWIEVEEPEKHEGRLLRDLPAM
ncbi:hypothetical protein [Ralstonia sp.]|uniref:hypothetical protein n=1 Tax=Ralstonia sp. TaxID=54061 RepID=UPI002B7E586F|nr:hypothetical protein [Ralstonia sp.]HWV04987.1 hypothetical protein [Ralstonia sp.]